MEDSGWITVPIEDHIPKKLAEICGEAKYKGPFELIFYSYYAFPTDFPEDIKKIFGQELFRQEINPEALEEFLSLIHI